MADEDLHENLAKADLEKERLGDEITRSPLHDPKIWEAARKAYADGFKPPEARYYVVISPTGPVSTAQKLQQLAKMTSTPKVHKTIYTDSHGDNPEAPQMQPDGKPREVSVGEVSWEDLKEIKGKTDYDIGLWVKINGKAKGALLVKGPKKAAAK